MPEWLFNLSSVGEVLENARAAPMMADREEVDADNVGALERRSKVPRAAGTGFGSARRGRRDGPAEAFLRAANMLFGFEGLYVLCGLYV